MRNVGRYLAVAGLVAYFGACTSEDRNFGANGNAAAGQGNGTGGTPSGKTGGVASNSGGASGAGTMIAAKVPCQVTSECDDKNTCNGVEICASGFCAAEGVDQRNGSPCAAVGAAAGASGAAGAASTLNGMFCTAGSCVIGRCGDGYVDSIAGEECDDANDVARDGCELTCKFTCSTPADCADGDVCNGEETCVAHKCSPGTPVADASDLSCAPGKNCRSGQCVLVGCGNGTKEGAEECDDGNNIDSDGCQADCTYTCKSDAECDDGNACTGMETCDKTVPTAPLCKPGTAVVCNDQNECTTDACDPTQGTCTYSLIDADGDGEAPATLACGTDCDDADRTVGKGMPEVCGDNKDNDCNPNTIDASQTTYYQDCDGDGFSERGGSYVVTCDPPGPSGKCGSGLADKWTVQPPDSSATIDCYDANPDVRPTQTAYKTTYISGVSSSVDFDYDCDSVEQPYYTTVGVATDAPCASSKTGSCIGADGWVSAAVPACGVSGSYSECGCASPVIIGFNQVTAAAILPGSILGCTYGCARSVIKRVQSCR